MNANTAGDVLCAQVKADLQSCQSTQDFVKVYDGPATQMILDRMRTSLTTSGVDADTWSRDWAIRMRTALVGPDIDLNMYRKTVLSLLYELCNAWNDASNPSVTAESIVNVFQGHRVENILALALPLDRAQCLFAMKYPMTPGYGMHWVSSKHIASEPEKNWAAELRDRDGRNTMNKRLLWLADLEGLKFGSSDIARWLKSTRCENFMEL